MSYVSVDNFTMPWTTDGSGLWAVQSIGLDESGFVGSSMQLSGQPVDSATAYIERLFSTPLDLSRFTELRFWIKSSRSAVNLSDKPFYLRITVREISTSTDPDWYRLIPVKTVNRWELVRLWVEDMPATLRGNISSLRFEAMPHAESFNAYFYGMIACDPNAIADVEQSLIDRFQNRFSIITSTGTSSVAAIIQDPTNNSSGTQPYIQFSPILMSEIVEGDHHGNVENDNYTLDGIHSRVILNSLRLTYAIDVFTEERAQTAEVISYVISDLALRPMQFAAGHRISIKSYEVDSEILREFLRASRTPFFIQLTIPMDIVTRTFHPWAEPFLRIGPVQATHAPSETIQI